MAFPFRASGVFWSFCCGWLLASNYTLVLPFETIAIGALFKAMLPGLDSAPLYSMGAYPVTAAGLLPGVGIGLFLLFLNYRGVKNSVVFQTVAMYLILAITVVFTVVAVTRLRFPRYSLTTARFGQPYPPR